MCKIKVEMDKKLPVPWFDRKWSKNMELSEIGLGKLSFESKIKGGVLWI